MALGNIQMTATTARLVEQGQAAWESLKRVESWDQWRTIGFAIDAGRKDIMNALGNPNPDSKRLKDAMGAWLNETGFNEIDKGVRSRLKLCMEHLTLIEEWRRNLDPGQRVELNHPNSIWRKFKLTLEDAVPKPPRIDPKDEELAILREELIAVQDERDAARAEVVAARAEVVAARAEVDAARAEVDAVKKTSARLVAATARVERARVRAELVSVHEQLDLDTRVKLIGKLWGPGATIAAESE
jgi:hypothetical protein